MLGSVQSSSATSLCTLNVFSTFFLFLINSVLRVQQQRMESNIVNEIDDCVTSDFRHWSSNPDDIRAAFYEHLRTDRGHPFNVNHFHIKIRTIILIDSKE